MNVNEEFMAWAAQQDIPAAIVEALVKNAPKKENLDPEVPYLFDHLQSIMDMNGKTGIPVPAISSGLLLIGCCGNGDPVAIDLQKDVGAISYLSHEEMFGIADLRSVSVCVARDIRDFLKRMANDPDLPLDYFGASKQSHR
jgi:hypothetical protein